MHLVIVGGGAIGCLYGYYLARENHHVTIVDTDPAVVSALTRYGIEYMGIGENNPDVFSRVSVNVVSDPSQIEHCDLVLLTVKSSATAAAAEKIAHLVSVDEPLLSLQAGLGNIEILGKILPDNSFLAGFTFMSGTHLGGSRIRHGGHGTTFIGELTGDFSDRLDKISELFQECSVPTMQVDHIEVHLWSKVIVDAAINPVSAILRVTNGCLLEKEESRALMEKLIDEGCKVGISQGLDLTYPNLWEALEVTCAQSVNNISPMLQDILNEHSTEIEAQNGMLCTYGREKGVVVTSHENMVNIIKLLEYWNPGSERRC